jgi:histidinol dehydrogenase
VECDRVTLGGDPTVLATELRALVPAPESVQDVVTEIMTHVRATGDDALRYYTRQYDTGGAQPAALRVPEAELDTALEQLDPAVRSGLERAIENVRRVAEAALHSDRAVQFDGHEVVLREVPVDRAGLYVPGGRAPYPSTVVMGTLTARVAGVQEIAVCAPPGRDGDVDHVVLAACRLAGASVVYRMGGAQAIAALAYGTETVSPVDVIVGPGNLYVQEAKRQVFGAVGIDGFAGPSDLIVIAGSDADPSPLALDLLAQAEHGPGTLVIGISESSELLAELSARLQDAPDTGAVARLVQVADVDQALALAEAFAPEHLELVGEEPQALAPRVSRAGCVFLGADSATAFGDYIAGSNHVLPTNGAARFASALSPAHFRRSFTEVRIGSGAGELARLAAPLARAEGFELHARSMEARIRDNGKHDPAR